MDDCAGRTTRRQGRVAAASADAAECRLGDRRAVGRERDQLCHGVPGRREVPDVLSRQPLFLSRRQGPAEHARSVLLRRKLGRHPLDEAGTGAVRLERLEAEQHRLGRRRGPCLRAVPRHESQVRGRRDVQGARRGGRQARAVRVPVGGRNSLDVDAPGARHHEGGLRLAQPRVLGCGTRRVPRVPPRLPRRTGHPHVDVAGFPALDRAGVPELLGQRRSRPARRASRPT